MGEGYDLPVRVRGVRTDGTVVVEGEIRLWVTAEDAEALTDGCCRVRSARSPTIGTSSTFFSPTSRFCTEVAIQVRTRLTAM